VIDITLPDGSGLELLRALRPVQIVHSSASDDVLERVRRDGRADAVVPKTGEIEPLLAALRELRR
jgi:DNA-binding response OmpR family regulator